MDLQTTRRKRLQLLVDEYGSQTALAEKLGIEPNYISRALAGKKRIKEDFTERVEKATNKPFGWMSQADNSSTPWPFDFDRSHWDNLPPDERLRLSRTIKHMVLGTEEEVAMRKSRKRAG